MQVVKFIATTASTISSVEINYFTEKVFEYYGKIRLLEAIVEIYEQDPNTIFYLKENSPAISLKHYAKDTIPQISSKKQLKKAKKPDYISFCFLKNFDLPTILQKIRVLDRPYLYVEEQDVHDYSRIIQKPIYDFTGSDSLKLTDLSFHCPPVFSFDGIGDIIRALGENKRLQQLLPYEIEKNKLDIEDKKLDIENKRLDIAVKQIHILRSLQSNTIPSGYRNTLTNEHKIYMDKLGELGSQLGLEYVSVEQDLDMKV